ncbi:hypothetical protein ACGTJS_00325 [Faucicola mancuniensis]|uniref:hypothetical protein n=1 Tax=Faucicola mancuniensis TaxID=1309795 RepID=UPI003977D2FE
MLNLKYIAVGLGLLALPTFLPNLATAQTATSKAMPMTTSTTEKGPAFCQGISKRMKAVNTKTTIDNIHQINQDLKYCVKSADNKQLLIWVNQHSEMYDKFTSLPIVDVETDNDEGEDLYVLADDYYKHGKANLKGYKNLSPRAKYLAQLLGNSEIILYNEGEGYFSLWYQLKTTVDIFAPYLHDDQATYLKRIAKDAQEAFFNDAGITWHYDDIIETIVFWENFNKKYPNSALKSSANQLGIFYQYQLFFGSDNTQWTDDDITTMYDKKDLISLQKVAKMPNSPFVKNAKTYLAFLQMSQSERDKNYPVNKLDEDDTPKQTWQIAREQLKKALYPLVNKYNNDKAVADNCLNFLSICPLNK